jgi:hypothetical protein
VFLPPFPESSDLALDVPAGLEDESGRRLGNAAKIPATLRIGIAERFDRILGVAIATPADGELPIVARDFKTLSRDGDGTLSISVLRSSPKVTDISESLTRLISAREESYECVPSDPEVADHIPRRRTVLFMNWQRSCTARGGHLREVSGARRERQASLEIIPGAIESINGFTPRKRIAQKHS